ncbi:hypothetical protein N7466_001038 [Penicillium verhagenii]|uniref:uncharacterized protein n=1 Tax=Penicillium verhagenii TaxID=1562060 RepID=UPI0025453921|nr:uncharacterized protein N7466_001038 [Penicillium verhagenii]KAJ5948023.1 hypothetical protein N7466_001038 [Penicillium verhagenii]
MSASPSTAAKPDKGNMSSRLLTMKFMQRAAASAASKEAQSPGADDSARTPKRQRKSMEYQSPSTPQSDLDAIAAALAAEEQKRQEVIARQAAEAGETQWVLDIPAAAPAAPQSFVMATESIDADDDINLGGRRPFGNFKRKEKTPPPMTEEEAELEQLKVDNPARYEAVMEKRRIREARGPKLDGLTSISGAGGRPMQFGAPSSSKKKKKRKSGQ